MLTVEKYKADLEAQLRELQENKDFQGIHNWLCHPHTNKCNDFCRRNVIKDRLAIYGKVCDEADS